MDLAKIDKLLEGFTIPPRPDMLVKLQEEIESDSPDIKTIAHLINQDIGIAGFTLKVVNSPVMGLSRKVNSIEHACIFLGLHRLIKLVRSVALRFAVSGGNEDAFTHKLWNTSTQVANACSALAKHLDLGMADEAYTVGMFHDAGIALIFDQRPDYPDVLRHAYEQTEESISEYEEREIASSHEVLGFLIAQTWGLDAAMSNVIAYHHSCSIMLASGEATEKQLFALLKLAEHMVGAPGKLCNASFDSDWERFGAQVLDVLDLEDFQLLDVGEVLHGMDVENIYHH